MSDMDPGELIDLALRTNRNYTAEEQRKIGDFLDAMAAGHEAVRAAVVANPIPYRLTETRVQQYKPGHSPTPFVTVQHIVLTEGSIGHVQEAAGGWIGYLFDDAPGETSLGRGRNPVRADQDDAVIDVITEHLFLRRPI